MIYRILLLATLLTSNCWAEPPARLTLEFPDGTKQAYVPEEADVVVDRTNIGINLADHRYYSSERPFNNLALQMSPWQWSTNTRWGGEPAFPQDANGFPIAFPPGKFAGAVLDFHSGSAMGEYRFSPGITVDQQSAPGVWMRNGTRMLFRLRSPIAALEVKDSLAGEGLFYKPFVDRTKQFGTIRTMNWANVNDDRIVRWSNRTTPGWYTQADKEVCLEYQIELAEQCDANLWICIHHTADDDYVRNAAKLIKKEWSGQRRLFVEHSNEVWNWAFPQARYCLERSPITRSPLEYHMKRTAEIARIFREEGVEITAVLGTQSAAADHFAWVVGQVPLPKDINAIAIAPYFGYSIPDKSSVDRVLDQCATSIVEVGQQIKQWKSLCDTLGVELTAYEAGQHLAASSSEQANPAIVNVYIEANRHQRMYDLYRAYLRQWNQLTDRSVLCLFNSCYPAGRWGCWGLIEHEGQTKTPKYQAVLDHLGADG